MECRKETWGYFHAFLNLHGVDGGIVEIVSDGEGDAVFDGLSIHEILYVYIEIPVFLGCFLNHGSEHCLRQFFIDWIVCTKL